MLLALVRARTDLHWATRNSCSSWPCDRYQLRGRWIKGMDKSFLVKVLLSVNCRMLEIEFKCLANLTEWCMCQCWIIIRLSRVATGLVSRFVYLLIMASKRFCWRAQFSASWCMIEKRAKTRPRNAARILHNFRIVLIVFLILNFLIVLFPLSIFPIFFIFYLRFFSCFSFTVRCFRKRPSARAHTGTP